VAGGFEPAGEIDVGNRGHISIEPLGDVGGAGVCDEVVDRPSDEVDTRDPGTSDWSSREGKGASGATALTAGRMKPIPRYLTIRRIPLPGSGRRTNVSAATRCLNGSISCAQAYTPAP
jgi:hypothetical protein